MRAPTGAPGDGPVGRAGEGSDPGSAGNRGHIVPRRCRSPHRERRVHARTSAPSPLRGGGGPHQRSMLLEVHGSSRSRRRLRCAVLNGARARRWFTSDSAGQRLAWGEGRAEGASCIAACIPRGQLRAAEPKDRSHAARAPGTNTHPALPSITPQPRSHCQAPTAPPPPADGIVLTHASIRQRAGRTQTRAAEAHRSGLHTPPPSPLLR